MSTTVVRPSAAVSAAAAAPAHSDVADAHLAPASPEMPTPPASGGGRLARNVLVTFGAQIVSWALTFAVTLYLPPYVGAAGMGKLAFAMSLVAICGVVVALGTSTVLVREIARDHNRTGKLIAAALWLRLPLAFVVTGLLMAAVTALGYDSSTRAIVLLTAIAMAVTTAGEAMASALQGLEMLPRQSLSLLLERVVGTSLILGMVYYRAPLWAFAVAGIASSLTGLLFNLTSFRSLLPPVQQWFRRLPVGPDRAEVTALARAGVPFLGWLAFQTLYGQIDPVVLKFVADDKTVGWFASAFRLIGSTMFLPSAIATALLPRLSREFHDDPASFGRLGRRMVAIVMLCGVPISVLLLLTSRQIIEALRYPAEFAPTIPVLAIGGLGVFLWYAGNALGTCVIASDGQKEMCNTSLAACVLGIPLCIGFSYVGHRFFGNGAAGAMISHVVLESYLVYRYVRILPRGFFGRETASLIGRAVLAALPMAALIALAGTRPSLGAAGLIAAVLLGLAIYGGLCAALRCVDAREMLAMVRDAAQRRRGEA